MNAGNNSTRPLVTVMIRRGDKVAEGFPTKMLIPYIEGRKLLRTDAISGDGVKWTRLDQHFQLAQYFNDETSSEVLRDSPPPFSQENDSEHEVDTSLENNEPTNPPRTSSQVENQLNQMAEMLKDINR